MLDEYFYMLKHCNGVEKIKDVSGLMDEVLSVQTASVSTDLQHRDGHISTEKMRCQFAVPYGEQKISTEQGGNRMTNIRTIFNSPFRPFVLASTSIGQEGLDFHFYCRKIFHWNLPHNAIDLEQREGRINRYKGLVIRHKLAEIFADETEQFSRQESFWDYFFSKAEERFSDDKSGIKPFWYLDEGSPRIERFVPIHELSKDMSKYHQLQKTLALYRLTFGQPRQEELVEALKESGLTKDEISEIRKTLLINLSPYNRS